MNLQIIEGQSPQTYSIIDPDGVRVEARLRSAWGVRLNLASENPGTLIQSLLKWRLEYELWALSVGAQVLQIELPEAETVPSRFSALFPALSMVIYQSSQAGTNPAPEYTIRKLAIQDSARLQTRLFEVAQRFSTNFSSTGWTFLQGFTDFEKASANGTLYSYGDAADRVVFAFIGPTTPNSKSNDLTELIGVLCFVDPLSRGMNVTKKIVMGMGWAVHEEFGSSRIRSVVAINNFRMLAAFRGVPGISWFRSHQRFIG